MSKLKGDRFSVLFAVALFIGAGVISLSYIGNISADIERGAAISPFKATDFSLVSDFSKSSWMAFSNRGDENPQIADGQLTIANTGEKYSTMLAQPIMLSSKKEYNVSIDYQFTQSKDFSVKYGFISNSLIGKPDFATDLDPQKSETSFKYKTQETTPISFQYFRVLGNGEFNLKSIKIEEIDETPAGIAPSPTSSQIAEEVPLQTPVATPSPAIQESSVATVAGAKYTLSPGWNPFGSDKAIDTKSFTNLGHSVYGISSDGWKVAKPGNKDSNFIITANTGVYISNEGDGPAEITLSQVDQSDKTNLVKGWNLLYTKTPKKSDEITVGFDGSDKTLSDLMQGQKISKYIYIVDPARPSDLTKINFEKYGSTGANKIVWVYLF